MDSLDKTGGLEEETIDKLNTFDLLDQPEILLGKRQASYELNFTSIPATKRHKEDT